MNVGSLFSGVGLLDYGLHLAGLEHRWFCEADEFRRGILRKRVYDDVRSVGGQCERVDVVAGGFPCKGGSTAGKRNGFGHPETALWREMRRAVGELEPRYVVVENVANLLAVHDGAVWGEVVGDLAALGYDCWWDCLPAAAFGAPHLRDRVILVATHPDRHGVRTQSEPEPTRSGAPIARGPSPAVADAGQGGREGVAAIDGSEPAELGGHARRLGVPVEWGEYGPAIRRWEAVVGRAPEPLCAFSGVDAGRAARVERSRLSALGDGVQVQLGRLIGDMIVKHAAVTRPALSEAGREVGGR